MRDDDSMLHAFIFVCVCVCFCIFGSGIGRDFKGVRMKGNRIKTSLRREMFSCEGRGETSCLGWVGRGLVAFWGEGDGKRISRHTVGSDFVVGRRVNSGSRLCFLENRVCLCDNYLLARILS